MKETVGIIVAAIVALYANWTSMGSDNERMALDRIKNSQGLLIQSGAEQ
jgi:hypothetical protein